MDGSHGQCLPVRGLFTPLTNPSSQSLCAKITGRDGKPAKWAPSFSPWRASRGSGKPAKCILSPGRGDIRTNSCLTSPLRGSNGYWSCRRSHGWLAVGYKTSPLRGFGPPRTCKLAHRPPRLTNPYGAVRQSTLIGTVSRRPRRESNLILRLPPSRHSTESRIGGHRLSAFHPA